MPNAARAEHVGVGKEHLRCDALLVQHVVAMVGVVTGEEAAVPSGELLPAPHEVAVVAAEAAAAQHLDLLAHLLLVLVEHRLVPVFEVLPVLVRGGPGVSIRRDHEKSIHGTSPSFRY